MPYPYGTQNAPAVGNGLGGLPRRAVAAAAAAATSYPKALVPVGDPVLVNTNSNYTNYPLNMGGMIGSDIAVINYAPYNGSNYVQHLAAISVGPSGAALIGTRNTSITDNTYGIGLEPNSCFSSGSEIYWVRANALRKCTISGSTVTYTEVTTTLIPSTGTLTVGSFAYNSIYIPTSTDLKQYDGSNEWVYDMGDGTAIVIRFCFISSQYVPCAFLINGSGTIIKSMKVGGNLFSNLSSSRFFTIFKTGATQLTIYAVGMYTGTWYTTASNFDIAAGTATVVSTGSTSSPGTNGIYQALQQVSAPGYLRMYWCTTQPAAAYIEFKINSDYTPQSVTVTGNTLAASYWSNYKFWNIKYSDFECVGQSNPSSTYTGDSFLYPTAPSSQFATEITWDIGSAQLTSPIDGTTYQASSKRVKTIVAGGYETSTSAYGLPYSGPFLVNRINEKLFLMYFYDQSSTGYRTYVQVYRVA